MDGAVDVTFYLSGGPMTVHRGVPVGTNPATIATEILSMTLTGGGATLRVGTQTPGINVNVPHTMGQVTEQPDNTQGVCDFGVYFEIDLGGGQKLYNHDALHVSAVTTCAPPAANFLKVGTQPVPLFTLPVGGVQQGQIITVEHSTGVETFDGPCPDQPLPDPAPCDDTTGSLARYRIYVSPKFRGLFDGCPVYQSADPVCGDDSTFRLESPILVDSETVIGRSAAHFNGLPPDNTIGTPVGDAGTFVKDDNFTVVPAGFQGPGNPREIHTEIVALNLNPRSGPDLPKVRAGSLAPLRPKSFGEVESKSSTGLPINDFPADSFFDVFVEVDLPECGDFPGGTVYNPQALLVVFSNVNDLPPHLVVYIHQNSSFVQVRFKTTVPGKWVAGDLLGWLTLAGHEVGIDEQVLQDEYCAATEMRGPGGCCLPDGTCEMLDLQGCNDAWLPVVDNGEHYAGDGNPCKCGACCLPANGCVWPVLEKKCRDPLPLGLGGHFLGHGSTSCAHNQDGSCKLVGACCLPDNECQLGVSQDECIKLGGRYLGDGTTSCAHDAAGNCIPTVTEWGLVVMAVLVLTAGTVVVMRRRAMVRGGSYTR
jgi:hypothetical protein